MKCGSHELLLIRGNKGTCMTDCLIWYPAECSVAFEQLSLNAELTNLVPVLQHTCRNINFNLPTVPGTADIPGRYVYRLFDPHGSFSQCDPQLCLQIWSPLPRPLLKQISKPTKAASTKHLVEDGLGFLWSCLLIALQQMWGCPLHSLGKYVCDYTIEA